MNGDYYFRSYAVRNDAFKEMWFCVPEGQSEFPNMAYIYNWQDDSWAIRELPEAGLQHANYGPLASPVRTWDTWDGIWDAQRGSWTSRQISPLEDTIIGVDRDNAKLLILDVLDNTSEYEFTLERTNFPLEGHPKVTTITRVYPHATGTQPIQVEVGSHDYAGSPVRWKPPVIFRPDIDRKIDVRSTGELHAWRFSAVGNGSCHISGVTFEYEDGGGR
jgi:hypothetical protein